MTVTTPLEPYSAGTLAARCFAIVGSGPLADELARQLETLGVGRIDLFGRSSRLGLANQSSYRLDRDPDIRALSLTDIARYDAIFATGDNPRAVEHLNEMCLLAGVRLVVADTRGTILAVSVYPFGEVDNAACHTCCGSTSEISSEVSSDTRAGGEHGPTQRITAGFAVALGLPCMTTAGLPVTRRLVGSSLHGRAHTVDVLRNRDCAVCSGVTGPVRTVHTRNRWATPAGLADVGRDTLQQVVTLSDAIVTGATCGACGLLSPQQVAAYVNRRAPDAAMTPLPCPVCRATGSLQFETRRNFTLAELAQRFGAGPAPVRYALVRMAGATVCFDFSGDGEHQPGHWPLVAGAFAPGFSPLESGIADIGAAVTSRPDDG